MSDQPQDPGQPAAHPEAVPSVQHDGGELHAEPAVFGVVTAPVAISLAMIVVIAIMIWKKVPGAIGRALDAKIDLIRNQLAEAEALRKEAEALKAEYQAKAQSADKDREALLERARHEAGEIVAKAKTDAEALVERRTRMAEDKIAAEERSAIEQLRATAATAATRAAARIIAERHDAATDERLVDQAIKEIASR
jgi:F-type H+-transporting ATPase subunit b